MRTDAEFSPAWAVPPGRTISDLLASKKVSPEAAARSMQLSEEEFDDLLVGKSALTARVANRLEVMLGASAAFWLLREEQYREQLAELAEGVDPEDDAYKEWLRSLPIRQMVDMGWIDAVADKKAKLRRCLEFFGVPNLDAWNRTYGETREAAAFRTTDAHVESVPATAAWLRRGEVLADQIDCKDWNPALFESQLSKVRSVPIAPRATGQASGRHAALDLIREARLWFEQHEPSSPIPVLLKRAEQFVGKRYADVVTAIPAELLAQWEREE